MAMSGWTRLNGARAIDATADTPCASGPAGAAFAFLYCPPALRAEGQLACVLLVIVAALAAIATCLEAAEPPIERQCFCPLRSQQRRETVSAVVSTDTDLRRVLEAAATGAALLLHITTPNAKAAAIPCLHIFSISVRIPEDNNGQHARSVGREPIVHHAAANLAAAFQSIGRDSSAGIWRATSTPANCCARGYVVASRTQRGPYALAPLRLHRCHCLDRRRHRACRRA